MYRATCPIRSPYFASLVESGFEGESEREECREGGREGGRKARTRERLINIHATTFVIRVNDC